MKSKKVYCACDVPITDARRKLYCHYCGLPKRREHQPDRYKSNTSKQNSQKDFEILKLNRDMWQASNNAKCQIIEAMEKWSAEDDLRIAQLKSALVYTNEALKTCFNQLKDQQAMSDNSNFNLYEYALELFKKLKL